jgi:ATP-dependent RNA helicase DDX35
VNPLVEPILRAIASGFFSQAALAQPDGSYRTIRELSASLSSRNSGNSAAGTALVIHPDSVLFKRVPDCVIFGQVVETTKPFMTQVSVIDAEWLTEVAPHFYEYKSAIE